MFYFYLFIIYFVIGLCCIMLVGFMILDKRRKRGCDVDGRGGGKVASQNAELQRRELQEEKNKNSQSHARVRQVSSFCFDGRRFFLSLCYMSGCCMVLIIY